MNKTVTGRLSKRLWICSLFFSMGLLGSPITVEARQGGDLGMGLVGGVPSGVSGKYWLGNTNAVNFILGMNFVEDWVNLNADYVWHDFSLFEVPEGQLPLYYGMGPWVSLDRHAVLGMRGVIGIDYLFAKAPLDAFFEIGPSLSIIPETKFGVDVGLGMRYFF